ncbi:MAG: hypothetical protein IKS29_04675 [Oscillospiraceae bacterium]|nr:hypothetical protein [Oscillospiraceae bacterium]
MSDNVTPIRPQGSLRKRVVQITLAVCLAVLILAVVVVAVKNHLTDFGAVRRYFTYRNAMSSESFGTYHYDAHNGSRFQAYDEGLAVGTVGGLELLDDYGVKALEVRATMSTPSVQTNGEKILCYDVGGRELILAHETQGKLLELDTKAPILDANLSSGGAFCYISSEGSYKAVIPVYNSHQEQVYAWYSATAYFTQCAVSPDADTLAAVSIGEEEAAFQSVLQFFDTKSEEPAATVQLGDQLVYELSFLSGSVVCVWGENGLFFYRTDGKELGSYEPEGQIVTADFHGNGYVAVWLESNLAGAQETVCTFDTNGSVIATLEPDGKLLDLSVRGKYVSILSSTGLLIADERLHRYADTEQTGAATRVRQRADGSAILLTSTDGSLYLP